MLPELIMIVGFLCPTVFFKNTQHPLLPALFGIFYDRINYFQRSEAFNIFQHHTRLISINAGINQVKMIGH